MKTFHEVSIDMKLQWGCEPRAWDFSVHELLCLEGLLFLILSDVPVFLLGSLSSVKSGAFAVFIAYYISKTPKRSSLSRCAEKSLDSWLRTFLSPHLFFRWEWQIPVFILDLCVLTALLKSHLCVEAAHVYPRLCADLFGSLLLISNDQFPSSLPHSVGWKPVVGARTTVL